MATRAAAWAQPAVGEQQLAPAGGRGDERQNRHAEQLDQHVRQNRAAMAQPVPDLPVGGVVEARIANGP